MAWGSGRGESLGTAGQSVAGLAEGAAGDVASWEAERAGDEEGSQSSSQSESVRVN